MPKKTYTVKEVASLLGFSTNTVYKYLEEGRIKSTRLGKEGRFRVPGSEMGRLLQESRGETTQISQPETVKMSDPGIQDYTMSSHPQGAPSLFDWFIGFLSISLGFSQFIFPAYSITAALSHYLILVNVLQALLFFGGIGLIAFDILHLKKDAWHNIAHIILGLLYFSLAVLFIITGVIPTAVGYLAVSLIICLTAFVKPSEPARFLIYVNFLYFLVGIGVLIWPKAFFLESFFGVTTYNAVIFLILWGLGQIFLFVLSRLAVKKGPKFMMTVSGIIALGTLCYATFAFTGGFWGRAIYCVVLGSFAIIFPFADHFESFTLKSKRELFGSFAWLLGIFFVGSCVLYFLYYSFQSYIFLELKNRIGTAADIVTTLVDGSQSEVSAYAQDIDLIKSMEGNPGKNTDALDTILRQLYISGNNSIRRAVLTNKEGIIIDTYPYNLSSQGLDISNRDYFRNPKLGASVYMTGIIQPSSPGIPPAVLISSPVVDSNGNFLGVLTASTDIAEMTRRINQVKFGLNGSFILADSSGAYIIPPVPDKLLTIAPKDSLAAKAVAGESGVVQGYDAAGGLAFSAYFRVDPFGWGLVAQQPFSEVFRTYSMVGFVTFLVFVMSGVGSLVLIIYLKKKGHINVF